MPRMGTLAVLSCSFAWVSKAEVFGTAGSAEGMTAASHAWSVIALCGAEGAASTDLLAIQTMRDSVVVAPSGGDLVRLDRCP